MAQNPDNRNLNRDQKSGSGSQPGKSMDSGYGKEKGFDSEKQSGDRQPKQPLQGERDSRNENRDQGSQQTKQPVSRDI